MNAVARQHSSAPACAGQRRLPHPVPEMFTRAEGAHGRFFVSDIFRIAYLDIPRAASTTLRAVMRELGGPYRRLQSLFNNTAALRLGELSDSQRNYMTFTFVAEPIHHFVDGFAFVHSGLAVGFNLSDSRWTDYKRDVAASPRRSSDFSRSRLFYNPHLLPQAFFLNQRDAGGRRVRLDFIGKVGPSFARDWVSLASILQRHIESSGGTPPLALSDPMLTEHFSDRRSTTARSESLRAAEASIEPAALAALCRIRWQEFACLDWPLPPACVKEHEKLGKVAWLF